MRISCFVSPFTAAAVLLFCAAKAVLAAAPASLTTPLLTQSPDKLLAVLQSNAGRKEKADACRELAVCGDKRAVPALAGLLADDELSHMARYALETIPGASVNEALRDQLLRLHGRPLIGVIGSLGVRKDAKAVKPLAGLLSGSEPQVAPAAARALGSIGTVDAARAIQSALPLSPAADRLAFCEGLLRCAETFRAQGKVRQALALYQQLRELATVPAQVRVAALRGAILVQGPKRLGLLQESRGSGDYKLFSSAVRAALEMPDAAVTRALAGSLPQLRTDNQIVVIQALGTRADAAVIPALTPLVQAGRKPVRLAAVRAVAALGKPASLPVLLGLLDGGDADIAQAAKDGLAGIPGREADKAVLALLHEARPERRADGIVLAGRRRLTTALPELVQAANDDDAKVRLQAWQRLGELGTAAQVPALLDALLQSSDSQTLDAAGEALSSISSRAGKSEVVSDEVINAADRAQPKQKGALLSVLRSLSGDKALGYVRDAVRDPNPEVRNAGIRALSDWPDVSAAPDLLQVAQSSTEPVHRALAFRGYIRVASEHAPSTGAKLKLLRDAFPVANSADDKKLLLSSLADIPSVESLQLVAPMLSQPALADEAGAAAVKIAEKLNAKFKSDMAPVLNQVLKTAKSEPVLEKARKRIEQLGLKPE